MNYEMRALIEIYLSRLSNRSDIYAKQFVSGDDFQYYPVKARPTPEVMYHCFCEFYALGLYALSQDGLGKWVCFDCDVENNSLDILEDWLTEHHWHYFREGRRTGKSGHTWILFDKPIPGWALRVIGQTMLSKAGLTAAKLELFPKQDMPPSLGQFGSSATKPTS